MRHHINTTEQNKLLQPPGDQIHLHHQDIAIIHHLTEQSIPSLSRSRRRLFLSVVARHVVLVFLKRISVAWVFFVLSCFSQLEFCAASRFEIKDVPTVEHDSKSSLMSSRSQCQLPFYLVIITKWSMLNVEPTHSYIHVV